MHTMEPQSPVQPHGIVNCAAYDGGVRTEVSIDEIDALLQRRDWFVWLGLYEPAEALLRRTRPFYRDVYDQVVPLNETIDAQRELLTTALEAKLSLMSIAQNEHLKRLAAWAAMIAVPTMIAGIYGMNFTHMPELSWRYGYLVSLLAMVLACTDLYVGFRRSGWL